MSFNKNRSKSCRDCRYLLVDHRNICLISDGFTGIEKMKESMAYENCEDFKNRNLLGLEKASLSSD